jgi:hypothetical protein
VITLERCAVHEASHYVAVEILGGLVLEVRIRPRARIEFLLVGRTLAQQRHRHAVVAMCGSLAEVYLLGPCSHDTAKDDRREIRRQLAGCCHRANDPKHARRLVNFAAALVVRHSQRIVELAERPLQQRCIAQRIQP